MKNLITTTLLAGFAAISLQAATVTVSNDIVSSETWTANNEYILDKIIYVRSQAELSIEAGTVVRGVQGVLSGGVVTVEPGTLVISRDGKINAVGTPSSPIIFTTAEQSGGAYIDPFPKTSPLEPVQADTLVTGLWGGVIILGNAPINNDQSGVGSILEEGEDFIEGIQEPTIANPDFRGTYGGDDCHDSSGIMNYVSIRYGGFNLSPANEINGLTMGGVGAGTVLEFIEVIAGQDDGFEWFGGTVNSKFLLSVYNNDDAFDYDQGYCGLGQFWAAVQADNSNDGDKGGEFDGDDQTGRRPFATPIIYNMTVIGTGSEVKAGNGGGQIDFDADAGGSLFNSIIVESGIPSLDINGTIDTVTPENSTSAAAKLQAGLLRVRNNIWFRDVSDAVNADTVADHDAGLADLALTPAANGNTFSNPFIGGANFNVPATAKRYSVGGVYLRPSAFGSVVSGLEPYNIGTFFTSVSYKGAFSPSETTWTSGWTVPSQLGYFAE